MKHKDSMTISLAKALRWEPIAGIPELPCADFKLESYESGVLKLTLRFSWVKGNALTCC